MNNPYELELQKADLMIGIWQEVNRFSDRVLTLQQNHRSSIYSMMQKNQYNNNNTNNCIPNTNSNIISNLNNNNNINGHSHSNMNGSTNHKSQHKRRQRHYRFSTGNDTSSESDSESDDDINNNNMDNNCDNVSSKSINDIKSDQAEEDDTYDDDDSEYEPASNSSKHNHGSNGSCNSKAISIANGKGKGKGKKERKSTKGRCSGYNIYFGMRCKEIQKMNPNLEFASISRNIGNEWKNLVKSEQVKWNEIAAKTTKQRMEAAQRKEKKHKKQEKKRKLSELNVGSSFSNGNAMVSNIRIQGKEFKLTPNTIDALNGLKDTMKDHTHGGIYDNNNRHSDGHGPPHKKIKFDLNGLNMNNIGHGKGNGLNITNMNLLNHISTLGVNNNNMRLNGNMNHNNLTIFDQTSPALSLLSEALNKMPELQSVKGKGNIRPQ